MHFFEHEERGKNPDFNFAPMMDFLFLMMSLFAVLAISRSSIFDANIDLYQKNSGSTSQASTEEMANISIVIDPIGSYTWISELNRYPLENTTKVQEEIIRRYDLGLLPKDKAATKVLLHIDQNAPWKKIADLLFAVQDIGFAAHPVYQKNSRE
ncbi:MAG: biopolymer transporter ExbD [Chlamydiota bacterium]